MSKERIVKALEQLGLSNTDTQIFLFLAKNGPHEMREIALALNLHEKKVHTSLKDLQGKSIIKASIQHPLEFMAVPFKEVIDLFIEIKREQAKAIQKNKEELISNWRKVMKEKSEKN